MSENRISRVFLGTAILLLAWGAWLKFNAPEPEEELKEWVRRGGKLVGRESGDPYQGVHQVPFEQAPSMIEWEYHYVDGVRNGAGKEFYPGPVKRLRSLATYIDGKRQGPVTVFYRSGIKKMQANAVDSLLEGVVTFYNPDGTVKQRKVFEQSAATSKQPIAAEPELVPEPEGADPADGDGVDEPAPPRLLDPQGKPFTGTRTGTFHGGAKAFEHGYRDGRPHGEHQGWSPGGEPEYERPFSAGARHGTWRLWADGGILVAEEKFLHGQKHGASKFWHPGGELVREEGRFVHGAKHGPHSVTDADGKKLLEKSYDHGRLIGLWEREGGIVREDSTPLRDGPSLSIDAGEEQVVETIEIPSTPGEDDGLASVGFRYRLSSADPELPAGAARPFQVSVLQGGKTKESSDFEGHPGGWIDYQERFEISTSEPLSLELSAAPGALTIHLAGIVRLDQLEPLEPLEQGGE